MNKVGIIILLIVSCSLRTSNKQVTLAEVVSKKLKEDENAYEQFLLLGKCKCFDKFYETEKFDKSKFNDAVARLSFGKSPLVQLVSIDKMHYVLLNYLDSTYTVKKKRFMQNREAGTFEYSKEVMCEEIFQRSVTTRKIFENYLSDTNNYSNKSGFTSYLKNNKSFQSSEDW